MGLTGGIGSGKSAVSSLLAELGAAVIDADLVAREVVGLDTPGLAAVVEAFGDDVLDGTGALDRPRLGQLVFQDDQARARLNGIVHPLIGTRTFELMAAAEGTADYLVHDVPLLVENRLAAAYHLVVVVDAPVQTRLTRLTERGLPQQQARQRMSAQAGDAERRAAADVWLDNGGDPDQLGRQVRQLHEQRLVPFADNLRRQRRTPRPPIELSAPQREWMAAGERLRARLRHLVPDAVSVDHIGSTSVPALLAKDVIDLQVEVSSWEAIEALRDTLGAGGFPRLDEIDSDPVRAEIDARPSSWIKRVHVSADPGRAVNVHVRPAGSAGARLALHFRDRLREDSAAREDYAALKQRLAAAHLTDVDAYAEAKTAFVLAFGDRAGRLPGCITERPDNT